MRISDFIIGTILLVVRDAMSAPTDNTSGFGGATIVSSAGGKAICITGNIPVSATTNDNVNFNYGEPPNQLALTETWVELIQINSTLLSQLNGGSINVSGTFNINSKLCFPTQWSAINGTKTLQFLIHGIGFEKDYWDVAPGYSYIDVAAEAGYPTFSYDRLGTGLSDHPDPIKVVQSPIEVEIAHSLIQTLRSGGLAGQTWDRIVGVGHSFGSTQSVGLTVQYPKDYDVVVLTGFTTSAAAVGLIIAGWNGAIANQNQPSRFGNLPNGYVVTDTPISNQLTFLRYPNFDPALFAKVDASKEPYTVGEIFTLGKHVAPAPSFTGPVNVVNGRNDFIFCQSDCLLPFDQSAAVLSQLYPNRAKGSDSIIVDGVGHAINIHYAANDAFNQIQDFVKSNGF
ncbi:hypothetical protein Unana1_08928 [Umbelopsis nana]